MVCVVGTAPQKATVRLTEVRKEAAIEYPHHVWPPQQSLVRVMGNTTPGEPPRLATSYYGIVVDVKPTHVVVKRSHDIRRKQSIFDPLQLHVECTGIDDSNFDLLSPGMQRRMKELVRELDEAQEEAEREATPPPSCSQTTATTTRTT